MRPCGCGGSFELPFVPFPNRLPQAGGLGVWRYAASLPPVSPVDRVTLAEGGTPLVRLRRLENEWGLPPLFLKVEGANPTGSFKDRGMTVAVSLAKAQGYRRIACASTGNTAASAAAYANRAGLPCTVYVPEGGIAEGKLAQLRFFGAHIESLPGSFDDAQERVLAERERDTYLVNSVNPFRLEGQKTLAFETWEQLGREAPEEVWLPVGNGGNISALHKAFRELSAARLIDRMPRLVGAQAAGAQPLARALRENRDRPAAETPETVASAIRIGRPVHWDKALRAARDTGGSVYAVDDAEILSSQRALARLEGIWVEPASAAPLAALRRHGSDARRPLVVVATGNGLKDPSPARRAGNPWAVPH